MEKNKSHYGIVAVVIAAVALMVAGFAMQQINDSSAKSSKTIFAMDTACTLTAYGNKDFDFSSLTERISSLDELLSAYNEKSEIFSLNKSGGGIVSDDVKRLIEQAVSLTQQYGKADITVGAITKLWNVTGETPNVPSEEEISEALKTCVTDNIQFDDNRVVLKNGAQLDFGAVGKGFALDEVKKSLDDNFNGIISFGSSSLLCGERPDGKAFEVSIADPDDDSKNLCTFETKGGFISTSGGYERFFEADGKKYSHIFDVSTGRPVETDLTSVTVMCDSGIKSDFLSTCIYIGGTKNLGQYLDDDSIQIICADDQKNIYVSDSLRNSIEIKNTEYTIK